MQPQALSIPTADELQARDIVDRLGLTSRARVEQLGLSGNGRSIDMISVGEGDRSALIVGAPHPNEPTGCLTALRLLSRLATGGGLTEAPGWQWHVIPAIDIDGVALNQQWFSGPLTLDRYLRGFFRPPFRLQPEYGFPLELPEYRFQSGTPESACWQRALELVRPDLQCSLHGADTGGAFFIISRESPELAERLASLPAAFGVSLNPTGEPFADMEVYQPGILSFPPVESFAARLDWNAGDSSAGYADKRFGTFSITCEAPLWHDPREVSPAPSDRTMADVIGERIVQLREDEVLLTSALPQLAPSADTFESRALVAALEDALNRAPAAMVGLRESTASHSSGGLLPVRDLVRLEAGTTALRTPAMLARLAGLAHEELIEAGAEELLSSRLRVFSRTAHLKPVSLEASTGLQLATIVEGANALSASR